MKNISFIVVRTMDERSMVLDVCSNIEDTLKYGSEVSLKQISVNLKNIKDTDNVIMFFWKRDPKKHDQPIKTKKGYKYSDLLPKINWANKNDYIYKLFHVEQE